MKKEKYERSALEIILFCTEEVLLLSESDDYEGWNPVGGSDGSGYEGWNPQ